MTVKLDGSTPAEDVFKLAADELRNDGPQPSGQQQEEQRVPYDRFKEVNDERKQLLELVQQFQAQQVQPQVQQPVVQQQQPVAQPQSLFTEDELSSFENDIVLDPKATLQKFGQALMERGVKTQVSALEQSFDQKLAQLTGQFAQQALPGIIGNFKQTRFAPHQQAEAAAFDQAIKGLDPATLQNPATLENVRLAAIGYVADQRAANPQQQTNQQAFFTEQPGGMNSGWGGFGQQQNNQVPNEVVAVAQRMGVDPKEAASMYSAMAKSGVFRQG